MEIKDIRDVLRKRFDKVARMYDFHDRVVGDEFKVFYEYYGTDRKPYYAHVGTVCWKNWWPDQLSFIEITNGRALDELLIGASKIYEEKFRRKLKMIAYAPEGPDDPEIIVLLGTKAKIVNEYLRNYRAA